MSTFEETLRSLAAAIRVIRHDASAFDDFNVTVDGFWRSFWVLPVLAPLAYPVFLSGHAYDVAIASQAGLPAPKPNLIADYVFLAVSLPLWAIVAALLARLFGLSTTYLRYIIAYNWISAPALALSALPHLLLLAGVLDAGTASIPLLIVFAALAYLSWYVARQGLGTNGAVAAVFVAADYAVSIGLDQLLRG